MALTNKHIARRVVVVVTAVIAAGVTTSFGAGCGAPGDDLEGVTVVSADLSGWSEAEVAMIGGFVTADATLTFTDQRGVGHAVPVGVGGPVLGFVFEFDQVKEDELFDGSGGASLDVPDDGVPVAALFKTYSGSGAAGGIGIGGTDHELENDAGVGLDAGGLGVAIGMIADFEWFNIDPKEDVR